MLSLGFNITKNEIESIKILNTGGAIKFWQIYSGTALLRDLSKTILKGYGLFWTGLAEEVAHVKPHKAQFKGFSLYLSITSSSRWYSKPNSSPFISQPLKVSYIYLILFSTGASLHLNEILYGHNGSGLNRGIYNLPKILVSQMLEIKIFLTNQSFEICP